MKAPATDLDPDRWCDAGSGPLPAWRDAALVLCAHGVRGGVGAAATHAGTIAAQGLFAETRACAHKGWPGLTETLAAVAERPIYLVPLLMAEGYTLRAMLAKLAHAGAPARRTRVTRPIGTNPALAWMIAEKGRDACAARGWSPAATTLLLVGHGTRRDPGSALTTRAHAAAIAASGAFAAIRSAFLDQAPEVGDALAALPTPHAVAVGLFVDRGEHGEEDIPRLLAATGKEAVYGGPVGVDHRLVKVIVAQVRALGAARGAAGC